MKVKKIEWSEEKEPDDDNRYNRVVGKSPIGEVIISWKGWKNPIMYDLEPFGNYSSCLWGDLENAKQIIQEQHDSMIKECLVKEGE